MDGVADAVARLASHTQDEVNPAGDGDFVGDDGLLVCGKCGMRKQKRVELFGIRKTVPVVCECRAGQLRREAEEQERKERELTLDKMRSMSLMSEKFRGATFEAYKVREENREAYKAARAFAEQFDRMYEEGQGLLLYGPVGTGKSFTAACIANKLLDDGVPVIMTSFVRILRDIQPGGMDESDYMATLGRARLLIIDDLGAERETEYALEKVYSVIDERTRQARPLILTTNMSLAQMRSPSDMRYERVYDRIFEACCPIQMAGRSMRLDEGNRRFAMMRKMAREVAD